MLKRAAMVGLVLALAVVVLGAGALTWLTVRAHPETSGTVEEPELREPVTVRRDAYGIAHITAATAADLFYAQGWVHASERMWQMEVWRHISSGRLSELFGAGQLDTDRFIRTLDWRGAAERDRESVSPATRVALDGYARGVNAWLDEHRGSLGIPFVMAGAEPEPWTDLDTLALGQGPGLEPRWQPRERDLPDARGRPARRPGADGRPADAARGRAGHHDDRGTRVRRLRRGDRLDLGHDRCRVVARRDAHRRAGGRLARARRPGRVAIARSRASMAAMPSPPTTASAPTTGSSARRCRRPAARCWRTTRTSASRCRRSGSSTACTARRSMRPVRTTWRGSASRGCPVSSSATTRGSPGGPPTSTRTCRISSSRRSTRPIRPAISTRTAARSRSPPARRRSPSAAPTRSSSRSARRSTVRSSTTSTAVSPTPRRWPCAGRASTHRPARTGRSMPSSP